MEIISWNVNGIHSCIKNGMIDFMLEEDADIYCFQEVKSSKEKFVVPLNLFSKYKCYKLFGAKPGYSGLIIFSKHKPIDVIKGVGDIKIDSHARILTLEFENFYLVNAYFPHSGRKLENLDYKLDFNLKIENFCKSLLNKKSVILTGDFNVAHKDIDLTNDKANKKNAGFTSSERNWFEEFLNRGFIDTFREFEAKTGHYTWWSNMANCRERNIGWRLDYFLISSNLKSKLQNGFIMPKVLGSDHCPIGIEIDFE